jgi:hypothetical protein
VKAQVQAEVTYHPYADCTEGGCPWARNPGQFTREQAKQHVKVTGHEVVVVVEKRTLYGRSGS